MQQENKEEKCSGTPAKRYEDIDFCDDTSCPKHGGIMTNYSEKCSTPQNKEESCKCECHDPEGSRLCAYKTFDKNCCVPAPQTPDSWEKQFREYFDKMLKPKKPSMGNLDREILVDFIKKQCALAHSSGRREGIELALREIEDAIAEEPSNFPDKQDVVYHVLERVQAEIKSLLDKDLT